VKKSRFFSIKHQMTETRQKTPATILINTVAG